MYKLKGGLSYNTDCFSYWQGTIQASYAVMRQLLLDVVRWLSLDRSTTFMRYSSDVKLFWQTGLHLFHERFLRYMSGPKNQGQVIKSETTQGNYDPQEA